VIESTPSILYHIHLHLQPNFTQIISILPSQPPTKFHILSHELIHDPVIAEYIILGSNPYLQRFKIHKSHLSPSLLSWNTITKIKAVDEIIDSPRTCRKAFLSPSIKYIAITDWLGRVLVYDTQRHIIIKILKGMRDAQVAWFKDLMIVYLARGLVEIYSMEGRVLVIDAIRNAKLSTNAEFGVVGFVGDDVNSELEKEEVLKTGIYLADYDTKRVYQIGILAETLMLADPYLFDNLKLLLKADKVEVDECLRVLVAFKYPKIQVKGLEYFQPKHFSIGQYAELLTSLIQNSKTDTLYFKMQLDLLAQYEKIRNATSSPLDSYPLWLDSIVLVSSIPSTGNFLPVEHKLKIPMDYLSFVRCFCELGKLKQLNEKLKMELQDILFDGVLLNSTDFQILDGFKLDRPSFIQLFTDYLSVATLATPKPIFWRRSALFLFTAIKTGLSYSDGVYYPSEKSELDIATLTNYCHETDQPLIAQLICVVLIQIYTLTNSESAIADIRKFLKIIEKVTPLCLLIPSLKIISSKFNILETYSLPLLLSQACPNNYQITALTTKLGQTVDLKAVDAYRIFTAYTDWISGSETSLEILVQFIENLFIQSRSQVDLLSCFLLKQFLQARLEEVVKVLEELHEIPRPEILRLDKFIERILYLGKLLGMYISTWSGKPCVVLEVVRASLGDLENFDDLFGQFISLLPEIIVVDQKACVEYQIVTAVLYFTTKFGLKAVVPSRLFPNASLDKFNLKNKFITLVDQDRAAFISQLSVFDVASGREMTEIFNSS
jgi:Rab3 GTPase-activating protein regulatory subunit N-terminus